MAKATATAHGRRLNIYECGRKTSQHPPSMTHSICYDTPQPWWRLGAKTPQHRGAGAHHHRDATACFCTPAPRCPSRGHRTSIPTFRLHTPQHQSTLTQNNHTVVLITAWHGSSWQAQEHARSLPNPTALSTNHEHVAPACISQCRGDIKHYGQQAPLHPTFYVIVCSNPTLSRNTRPRRQEGTPSGGSPTPCSS